MALADVAVRTAKPCEKSYRMFDSGGLYLEVSPSGGKWWRWKFRAAAPIPNVRLNTWELGSEPPEALTSTIDEIRTEDPDEDTEEKPERRAIHFVGEVGPDPRPKEHCRGEDSSSSDVHIAVPVVFKRRRETYWWKEYRKCRSCREVLREACPVDQCRYDDYSSTNAEKPRGDTTDSSNYYEHQP